METLDFDFFPKAPSVVSTPRKGYRPPVTSIKANQSVKEMKQEHYVKIIEALEKMKVGGTYVEISEACGLDSIQVGRRLSEMITAGTVFNVGTTRMTPSGRPSMIRQLVKFKTI